MGVISEDPDQLREPADGDCIGLLSTRHFNHIMNANVVATLLQSRGHARTNPSSGTRHENPHRLSGGTDLTGNNTRSLLRLCVARRARVDLRTYSSVAV